MQGPARGYPLWTCFLQLFKRILIKKTAFFEQGKVFDLVKVCLFLLLKNMQSQLKNHSTTIKNTKEEGKNIAEL